MEAFAVPSNVVLDLIPPPELVINFDQTFQKYHPTRGFTWEKKDTRRVQLKSTKDGYTICFVISAAGVISAQFIFHGKTCAVHPSVDPSDVLFYEHNPENHWSNEKTTVALWEKMIIPYISRIRAHLNNQTTAFIVLGDAFPAHWTDAVRAVAATVPYLSYIGVPDTVTLLFQPLDLGIIAAAKSSVMRRKDDFLERGAYSSA